MLYVNGHTIVGIELSCLNVRFKTINVLNYSIFGESNYKLNISRQVDNESVFASIILVRKCEIFQ